MNYNKIIAGVFSVDEKDIWLYRLEHQNHIDCINPYLNSVRLKTLQLDPIYIKVGESSQVIGFAAKCPICGTVHFKPAIATY